jgi:hypothetical protein
LNENLGVYRLIDDGTTLLEGGNTFGMPAGENTVKITKTD